MRNDSWLYNRIDQSIAEGADITVEWIMMIVTLAKKQRQVKKFEVFRKDLLLVIQKRNLAFHEDYEKLLKNCWLHQIA